MYSNPPMDYPYYHTPSSHQWSIPPTYSTNPSFTSPTTPSFPSFPWELFTPYYTHGSSSPKLYFNHGFSPHLPPNPYSSSHYSYYYPNYLQPLQPTKIFFPKKKDFKKHLQVSFPSFKRKISTNPLSPCFKKAKNIPPNPFHLPRKVTSNLPYKTVTRPIALSSLPPKSVSGSPLYTENRQNPVSDEASYVESSQDDWFGDFNKEIGFTFKEFVQQDLLKPTPAKEDITDVAHEELQPYEVDDAEEIKGLEGLAVKSHETEDGDLGSISDSLFDLDFETLNSNPPCYYSISHQQQHLISAPNPKTLFPPPKPPDLETVPINHNKNSPHSPHSVHIDRFSEQENPNPIALSPQGSLGEQLNDTKNLSFPFASSRASQNTVTSGWKTVMHEESQLLRVSNDDEKGSFDFYELNRQDLDSVESVLSSEYPSTRVSSLKVEDYDAKHVPVLDNDAYDVCDKIPLHSVVEVSENSSRDADQASLAAEQQVNKDDGSGAIDPIFLDALHEERLAEALSAQLGQVAQPPNVESQNSGDSDLEFLAALPPSIRRKVLAQQQAHRSNQSQELEGQPVEMDTVSIIARFPSDFREEVLLTSSDIFLANLTPALVAEANMLRERYAHRYTHTLFGMYPRSRRGETSRCGDGIGSGLDEVGGCSLELVDNYPFDDKISVVTCAENSKSSDGNWNISPMVTRNDVVSVISGANFGLVNIARQYASSLAELYNWSHGFHQAVLSVIKNSKVTKSSNTSTFFPLIFVSKAGDIEALKTVIGIGECDLDYQEDNGFSAVVHTTVKGHVESFRLLVYAGADFKMCHKSGKTTIMLSELNNNCALYEKVMLGYTLENGNPNIGGFYALHYAACHGDLEAVSLLTNRGLDVNVLDGDHYTPLILAAKEYHASICNFLISHGAHYTAKNTRGETTLLHARKFRGEYYDAGDDVHFGLPMVFTTTMPSWSIIEFGGLMKSCGDISVFYYRFIYISGLFLFFVWDPGKIHITIPI